MTRQILAASHEADQIRTNTETHNDIYESNPHRGVRLAHVPCPVSICFGQPVITNQPTPQATAPGTTVTFQVGASSIEPLAYQWQKNPGNGFSNLADGANAALVLTNVQPWDASEYRVVVANSAGARTSTVARLYVVRPGLVTTNVVIDNFNDNKVTGWIPEGHKGQVKLTETNQQFKLWGYWPGVSTMHMDLTDTEAYGSLGRSWSVLNGQTVEWRVDLVDLNEHATMAGLALWSRVGHAFAHWDRCGRADNVRE